MTEGPTDASSKLRLVLDYLPCEACLSKPVADQDLLCSVCRRLDRDVDVTTVRRMTVLLERPTPVLAAPAPPAPLPPPEETPVPAPVEEAPAPVEVPPPPPPEEPFPVVGVDVLTEEYVETPPPAVEVAPIVEVEAQEEPPEAPPEPAPEPARKRGFSLFRRKTEEAPAEPEPEPEFDDVAGFEPKDDSFGFVREEPPLREVQEEPDAAFDFTSPPEERPAEAPAPVVDELEDDFLYRPAPEPERDPFLLEDQPIEAPREEVSVEPEGQNPWAPPGERLAQEPAPEEWPNESQERAPEPEPFFAPEPEEEPILETEMVEEEPAAEEEIFETEIVEMEVVADEEPAPAPAEPEPARPAEEKRRGGFSSLFKRGRKPAEEERAPEPAPEPEPPVEARESAWAPPGEAAPAQEMDELREEAPAPAAAVPESRSDLYRLAGFARGHEEALALLRIESLSHLSGHDPVELAERTGIDPATLAAWVQVADLANEVGVPLEAALALVAAGVPGPRGLRDMDARAIVDMVGAADTGVTFQNVKRWKRRA